MQRTTSYKMRLQRAILLGLLACTLNFSLTAIFGPTLHLHLGNVFIFAAILALGVSGGLIAVLIGSVLFSVSLGAPAEIIRLSIFAILIGSVTNKTYRVNCTSLVALCWLVAIGPAHEYLFTDRTFSFPLSDEWLLWSDMLCSLLAGIFLLNSNIWCRLTERPRHVSLSALSSHALSAIALAAVFTGYVTSDGFGLSIRALVFLVAAIQLTATYGGHLWARFLLDNFHSLSRDTLVTKEDTATFSGLTSEHWRRRQKHTRINSSKGIWKRPIQFGQSTETVEEDQQDSPVGVCVLDSRNTIMFANKHFMQIVGIKSDQFIGRRLDSVGIADEWTNPIRELVSETLANGVSPRQKEIKFNSAPNPLRYFEISSRRASSSQDMLATNDPDSVIVTVRDISDRRTIESGLVRVQRLESLGALMNGIAHEINNCLTAIAAKASLASNSNGKSGTQHDALKDIVNYACSTGELMKGLLNFAEGSFNSFTTLNVNTFIEKKLSLLSKVVGEAYEIKFTGTDQPVGTHCNQTLIEQAITNLVIYARDAYDSKGGEIKISLNTEKIEPEAMSLPLGVTPGFFCRLRVSHTGASMNRNVIAKIFDPSQSARNSGLGLSIVFAIIRAHDGFLTAESHPGKETTISLYIPYVECVQKAVETKTGLAIEKSVQSAEQSETTLNGKSILVVEDEPNVRELTSFMLKELGCHVTSCENGTDAVNLATANAFDLILVDYVIPRLNGHDLLEKLHDCNEKAKTLVMTGYGNSIKDELASNIIEKPFDMDGLADAVMKALAEGD